MIPAALRLQRLPQSVHFENFKSGVFVTPIATATRSVVGPKPAHSQLPKSLIRPRGFRERCH